MIQKTMLVLMTEYGVRDRHQGRCLSKPVVLVRDVDHFKSARDVAVVKTESFIYSKENTYLSICGLTNESISQISL